jgi:hypothetical protein
MILSNKERRGKMFFIYITFSLVLSIAGGTLVNKHQNAPGWTLLVIGILCLIYTIIYYSRRNKRIELRKKKGIEKKDSDLCIFLDCFDVIDGDMLNCGGHGHGGLDCGDMDCGGLDCGS